MDRNGKICERKKKGRLYSLGGNDPPKKCNRGRLDRLKTVGTFDITNEISILSKTTMNLNEKIISNQLFVNTDAAPVTINPKSPKSRSLSTGSYMAAPTDQFNADKIIKSNSNSDINVTKKLVVNIIPKNKSLEDTKTLKLNQNNSPIRKPILRKSKKITRTDSEFLKGNIYEKESSVSSSQYTPSCEKRKEFADFHNSNPSSETHKSTDESSKNISTDEIDTVFSDTMDLEQLEQDYKMHLKNNLQREYKSDSDTLDEVGKKRMDYGNWKNQSFENAFELFDTKDTEPEVKDDSSTNEARPVVKGIERPTNLNIEGKHIDGHFSNLFEKNLGRFRKMNKLLKCKRFSTSALYDKKSKPGYIFGENSPVKIKPEINTNPYYLQSKTSINSSKSSLFGAKKGKVFTLKGRKFLFSANTAKPVLSTKSSPNKSKSNNEINYFRTMPSTKSSSRKSAKNNSTACLNLETTCTSPLSEAFYNTTGSVRLSAMELYEKFCSQDFSGLYKHESTKTDTDDYSGTDSSAYEPQKNLGAIRKYKRKNFKLLRQKSEPKFSFRTDTLYENEDSYDDVCYHEEKDENEFENDEFNQFLYDEQYYEEDIENLSIENIFFGSNINHVENIDDYEGEDCIDRLNLPQIDMSTSMDSDCDEFYLMPQKIDNDNENMMQDFLFHRSDDNFERKFNRFNDKDTLTIYKLCSKESILDSKCDLDNIKMSTSLDPYFLKSDCLTLERTASLELLSNSSGTLNKSTLTDYAFDTVKNVNLDSCSTSKLSLSLKSEIFEESVTVQSNSGELKQIKSWNIEDFTLTPEDSFSDENILELEKGTAEKEDTPVNVPDPENTTNEYTIIDLDEDTFYMNSNISEFTSEITKEFDFLFSRAENLSENGNDEEEDEQLGEEVEVGIGEEELVEDVIRNDSIVEQLDLPSRYSMQKLEPISIEDDNLITRHEEDQQILKSQQDSAKIAVDVKLDNFIKTDKSTTRLKKARSQSLGNLKNKTKCFPL